MCYRFSVNKDVCETVERASFSSVVMAIQYTVCSNETLLRRSCVLLYERLKLQWLDDRKGDCEMMPHRRELPGSRRIPAHEHFAHQHILHGDDDDDDDDFDLNVQRWPVSGTHPVRHGQ